MQEQGSPDSTSSVTAAVADQKPTAAAADQGQHHSGVTDTVTQMTDNEEPATSLAARQDQQLPGSTEAVIEMMSDQGSRKYALAPGEDLFKSLFAAEKTPPDSPGSVASSGTLIGPSSRKVSPFDLGTLTKGSPTAVKDFAHPSPDSIRVDPVTMMEEQTKKELLKQVKEKTAAKEKASRKSEKLAARNTALSAELKSAKATAKNRDVQADIAKAHANAMTVSNVVLRQQMKDVSDGLSRENNGTQVQGGQSEGETTWDQRTEESLRKHLRDVDESRASAYGRMARLENTSAEQCQGLDNTIDQGLIQKENPSPTGEVVLQQESVSVAVQLSGRQASKEVLTDVVGSSSSTDASEQTQPETTAEVTSKEKVGGFSEKYGVDPAELSRILNYVTSTAQKEPEKKDTEVTQGEGALPEVEEPEVDATIDTAALTALEDYQRRDLALDEESATARSKAMVDPIATDFEDATPDQDDSSESDGEDQVFEADNDTSPSTAENAVYIQEPITNAIANQDDVQDVDQDHEGGIDGNYEFSEPAGPANLWGILQSNQNENNAKDNADAAEDTAGVPETADPPAQSSPNEREAGDNADADEKALNVSEVAGSAPLPGMHRSEQGEKVVEDQEVAAHEAAHASDYEAPGLANLWGILKSNSEIPANNSNKEGSGEQVEGNGDMATDESENNGVAVVRDHDNASDGEAPGPANLWGILKSNFEIPVDKCNKEGSGEQAKGNGDMGTEESESSGVGVTRDHDNVSDGEAPGPANLWGILKSNSEIPVDKSNKEGSGEQVEGNEDMATDESESNGLAVLRDHDNAELIDPSQDNLQEDTNGPDDVNDSGEESPNSTIPPTLKQDAASSPHGSADGDDITVEEVDTQDVNSEEVMDTIGVASPVDIVETVTDSIGGPQVVEENEHELENGAAEVVHLHETTITIDVNTPVGAAEAASEYPDDATVAQKEDQEEQAAEEANGSEVTTIPEQMSGSCEKEDSQLVDDDAVAGATPLREAIAEEKEGLQEDKTLKESTAPSKLQVTCEECADKDHHEAQDVDIASSSVTAERPGANNAVVHTQTLSTSSTSSTPPRPSSPFQVERFDFIGPVPQPKELNKTQKRKLERKRAAAKIKEEKALRRHMEEEAAKTPEALAQREAEELKLLGEKRLKLQEAKAQRWSETRLVEE